MKALFLIAQCIRLLHTDPWMAQTYQILEVGQYSYKLQQVPHHNFTEVLKFVEQKDYGVVECPK